MPNPMFRDFCLLQFAEEHLNSEEFLCFFYTWEQTAISLGKRQSNSKKIIHECISEGIPVCIRPSGGKAVLHGGDICFTFISKQSNKDFGGTLLESYSLVISYILKILNFHLGTVAEIEVLRQQRDETVGERTSSRPRRRNDRSVLWVHEDHEDDENAEIEVRRQSQFDCFASSISYEGFIEYNSKNIKVLGSAQIMYANSFLQQGSLRIKSVLKTVSEARYEDERVAKQTSSWLRKMFKKDVLSLEELLNQDLDLNQYCLEINQLHNSISDL